MKKIKKPRASGQARKASAATSPMPAMPSEPSNSSGIHAATGKMSDADKTHLKAQRSAAGIPGDGVGSSGQTSIGNQEARAADPKLNAGRSVRDDREALAGGGGDGQDCSDAQFDRASSPQPIRHKAGSRKADLSPSPIDKAPAATKTPRKGAKKARLASSTKPGLPSSQSSAGHASDENHSVIAGGGEDRATLKQSPIEMAPDLANHIATLRELAVQRRASIKLQVKIDNGIRALVGRACGFRIDLPEKERAAINKRAAVIIKAIETGEPCVDPVAAPLAPFILTGAQGRAPFDALRKSVEKDMEKLAALMPVYHFVEDLSGFGALGLSIIVGEAGDLSVYGNPAKLWKRMGLAVMSGKRQGNPGKGATADDWIAHGYNKERRSMMWQIMDSMMKHQSQWLDKETGEIKKPAGPYGEIYMAKKADYVARIEASADLPASDPNKWTPARADKAARRYTEKRLLRDLWRAWRKAVGVADTKQESPSAELLKAAE